MQDVVPSKAGGSDHIPTKFLKLFVTELSPCLLLIYKSSIEQGTAIFPLEEGLNNSSRVREPV